MICLIDENSCNKIAYENKIHLNFCDDDYDFVDDDFDEDYTGDYGEYDESYDDYEDEGWGDGTDEDYDY